MTIQGSEANDLPPPASPKDAQNGEVFVLPANRIEPEETPPSRISVLHSRQDTPIRRYTHWQRRKVERLKRLCLHVSDLCDFVYDDRMADSGDDEEESDSGGSHDEVDEVTFRFPKKKRAVSALTSSEVNDIKAEIRELALSRGGLMEDRFRHILWPRLLDLDPKRLDPSEILAENEVTKRCQHYTQVTMDVFRTLKRFPPGITDDQREIYQHQLTGVVCQVLLDHPELYYYQGYHDVALTLLLIVGERVSLSMMNRLSRSHLNRFMEPSMRSTAHLLNYLYPILKAEDEELFRFVLKSEVGATFSLPWVITWFSHSLEDYELIMRLYDAFLSSPPLFPIYLSAAVVLARRKAVLACECEMAAVHGCLSELPSTLNWEELLNRAYLLIEKYPPVDIDELAEILVKDSPSPPLPERASWLSDMGITALGPFLGPLSLGIVAFSVGFAVFNNYFRAQPPPP